MKPSIVAKLEALHERHEEVQALLGDAGTIADQDRVRALSREYAQLSDVSKCFTDWQQVQAKVHESLTQIQKALALAGQQYADVESANTKLFRG